MYLYSAVMLSDFFFNYFEVESVFLQSLFNCLTFSCCKPIRLAYHTYNYYNQRGQFNVNHLVQDFFNKWHQL
jgi:hypothetical protein